MKSIRGKSGIRLLVLLASTIAAGSVSASRTQSSCEPAIAFASVPGYGTDGNARGVVHCVDPASFGIATYILVEGSGWWTKPSFTNPIVPIQSDSTWSVDIVTGGSDIYATRVHVAIVPLESEPPECGPCCELPSLSGYAVAEAETVRTPRIVQFAGYDWAVKASVGPVGAGPTRFSDDPSSVWTDDAGLHLKLRKSGSTWYGAEVILQASFGYGCYSFELSGPLGQLDPNVVVGLFTWDNQDCTHHREIDLEFWRDSADTMNAQYVVQPWDRPGNRYRWSFPPEPTVSQHSICWESEEIRFRSDIVSEADPVPTPIETWTYGGQDIPTPGAENVRVNIWLQHGDSLPPQNGQEVEIVLREFALLEPAAASDGSARFTGCVLRSVAPNPFRTGTRIDYTINEPGESSLRILDVSGRAVRSLSRPRNERGDFWAYWDGADDQGRRLPPGTYFLQLSAGYSVDQAKVVIAR